ncbi:hypothetical protein ACOJA4_13695, partial [Corynebacterium striatum]
VLSILDRNAKAIPRGLHTARNVLVKLGNKHNKTTLEPACQQVIDHNLAPNMQVIARILKRPGFSSASFTALC